MAGTFVAIYCHVVFSTKHRQPFIREDIRPRVHHYIGGIVRAQKSQNVVIGGTEDHVHILMGLNKQVGLSDAVAEIKANSSRWIHETFVDLREFAWQPGYGAYSVHPDGLEKTRRYIEGQESHHREIGFEEEFRQLLDRLGIEYDPKLLWR
ncbi:MAG: IS200/IS605 family transposase [Armatimonadia bacterium]